MNLHWLVLGTVTILAVAAESVQLMRNARRKRRAHELRTRAIAAQGCRTSGSSSLVNDTMPTCDEDTSLYMRQHV